MKHRSAGKGGSETKQSSISCKEGVGVVEARHRFLPVQSRPSWRATHIYSYPRFEAEDGDGRVGRIRRIWPRPLIERGYRYQPLSAYPLGQRPSPQRRPGYLAQRIVSHLFPSPYASSYLSLSLENVSGSTNAFRYQRFERSVFSFCSPLGRR